MNITCPFCAVSFTYYQLQFTNIKNSNLGKKTLNTIRYISQISVVVIHVNKWIMFIIDLYLCGINLTLRPLALPLCVHIFLKRSISSLTTPSKYKLLKFGHCNIMLNNKSSKFSLLFFRSSFTDSVIKNTVWKYLLFSASKIWHNYFSLKIMLKLRVVVVLG